MRERTRCQTSVVDERARTLNRFQKTLEGAAITLVRPRRMVGDIQGVAAQAILPASAAGTADPEAPAAVAVGKRKDKRAELGQALTDQIGPHQQVLLAQHEAARANRRNGARIGAQFRWLR